MILPSSLKTSGGRRAVPNDRAGMAMVTVLILVVGMAGLAAAMLLRLSLENKSAEEYIRINTATAAAEAGLEQASAIVFGGYLQELASETTKDVAGSLDKVTGKGLGGLGGIVGDVTGGITGGLGDVLDNGLANIGSLRAFIDNLVPAGGLAKLLDQPVALLNGANIQQILLERTDNGGETLIKVTSTGEYEGRTRTIVQLFSASGEAFSGFDYALLANNISCILCHAEFDNVERVYNTDSSLYGTFDRVKIASLESLTLRTNDANSHIAGTLYARGEILGAKGSGSGGITGTLSPLTSLTGTTFKGYQMDEAGKIKQDKKGRPTDSKLDIAVTGKDGLLPKFGEVYANYPTSTEQMTDGVLPTEFPPIISDGNANKKVDDDEWKIKVSESDLGGVSGGLVYGVPNGATLDTKGLPTKSNAAHESAKGGYYDGNMVLVGTEKEPIQIDGVLAVNGDVLIKGPVSGAGKIIARNNIYFAGDTTYADGETFGQADDGTENLMSYGAGGNIVIGDFLTPESYNKDKYGKNKIVAFDDSSSKMPSYLGAETMDLAPALDKGDSTSYSSAQLMLSNQREYEKAQASKTYVPRYYAVQPGGRVYRQKTDATVTEYESWLAAEIKADEQARGTVSTLLPSSKWISPEQLKRIWWDDNAARPKDVEERFRIDGLLYTNNAIIGSAHSYDRHKSRLNGTLEVRGAIVAADVGILAPGDKRARKNDQGFRLYYDKRVRNYMPVSGSKDLALGRGVRLVQTAAGVK